jgi:hypothetical protein
VRRCEEELGGGRRREEEGGGGTEECFGRLATSRLGTFPYFFTSRKAERDAKLRAVRGAGLVSPALFSV